MKPSNDTLRQAMRLMQAGDLHAATQAIQRGLTASADAAAQRSRHVTPATASPRGDCIDGEFRVIDDGNGSAQPAAHTRRHAAPSRRPWPHPAAKRPRMHPGIAPGARRKQHSDTDDACFKQHHFSCDAGELDYKLYIPAGLDTANAPLLLMLHGCTQTPDDFARGTRMNRLAVEHGHVVAWPAQSLERNQNRCWNWFRGSDQQRGHGEPAMLAALARHVVATHRLDAQRVYVAGLSAGGAMAAVLASTHPDVFAAIGVHSGLPIGLASDVPSAFAAMRKSGGRRRRPAPSGSDPVPAIVFHGDGDTIVHPRNGDGVIDQSLGHCNQTDPADPGCIERGTAVGGRRYTRTLHRTADGRVAAEHWVVHGAAHAWAGGDAAGSYTDPGGPDASAEMLRFFAGCRRPGAG
jgi:poly(hydroxyalkanoate) depolymerase family esterase